ncbi:PREDICTED: zinc finger CCCH domain-containing protein 49-like [Fragaria vesca subsp. vesca]|uniref:zinc finger CCCH domain-containing protein 20 n=1 Tax=Fragaria vesca subsp. vesca TaxID=101020 RepID=UPI0002C368C2|nr:PREDICTED: zinc finger CCCH domain-containing protein 20 [Fragaria vesca subsp. vesca]
MMLGEPHRPNPTIHVPPWLNLDDPTAEIYSSPYPLSGVSVTSDVTSPNSPYHLNEALATLRRYLPSNEVSDPDPDPYPDSEFDLDNDSPVDAYSCDHFRMFEFKVRRCARGRSHDWTDCPFAHPGEKARRRDPRKFHYSGTACPDFRKGHCKKGDSCEFAHGVFECWLHPARYRTQPCKDGTSCKRRVCFFAHTPEQLRVLPQQSPRGSNSVTSSMESYDGSPMRQAMELAKGMPFLSASPEISPENSPPMSPMTRSVSRSLGSSSVSEMVASLRNLQLGKVKSLPTSWNVQVGSVGSVGSPGFVSPRGSMLRPGFCSLPSTPTRIPTRSTVGGFLDFCDEGCEEEVPMERVESGRDLRAKMFERLREENSLGRVDPTLALGGSSGAPDVGWVSELVNCE